MTFRRVLFFTLLLSLFLRDKASSVTTSIWEQRFHKDFEAGTTNDVSLTSQGKVLLAPEVDVRTHIQSEHYVWCLAEDSEGNVYAGTGNQGKIFRITQEGQTSLIFDSPEISILSLAVDGKENLYAGTGPDGLIYKITSEHTPPTTVLRAEEKYVWALTFDDSGNLYAATGTSGRIYKISDRGEPTVLFDSEDTNIMSLLYHRNILYAGSGDKGIIYRIANDGKTSVVYQTPEREIRALVSGTNDNIYAAAITSAPSQSGGHDRPTVPPPPGSRMPVEKKSYIYQIRRDGVVSKIWTAPVPLILSMVFDNDKQLIVGTGDEGRIYKVNVNGESMFLGKPEANQILAMHRTHTTNRVLLATGEAAQVLELKKQYKTEGTLESTPHDTQSTSRWGKLSWEATLAHGTAITFATRSGNTDKPDSTWSKWSKELTISEGEQIASPSAQSIQWRAKFTTNDVNQTPVLSRVILASAQSNIEPRFTKVEIQRGNGTKEPVGHSSVHSRKNDSTKNPRVESKQWTVQWQVEDNNKDTLQFAVFYRKIDDVNWKLLKKELRIPTYKWDTTSMPDGRYIIKVEATDKLSNPPAWAKSSKKTSDYFDIDNTQPTVTDISATANGDGTYRITCTTEDNASHIYKADYKIDGDQHWKIIFPNDGIFDSKRESLLLQTNPLPNGPHTLTIRVTDAAKNTAVGRASFSNE